VTLAFQQGDPLPPPPLPGNASYSRRDIEVSNEKNSPILRIGVLVSKEKLQNQQKQLFGNSMIFVAGSLLVSLLTGFFLSFSISRPVASLRMAAMQMASGDLHTRVKESGGGEMADLTRAFNRMAEQLEERQTQLMTQRIAAWQDIANIWLMKSRIR
jgi:nitrate/nitrite-specific signal transduction histidine kinase